MAKKVFVNAGHGGSDPGAVKYLVEKDINLKMAKACRNYLEAAGVEVFMAREEDKGITSSEIIRMCNTFNPDYAIDIHNNAGGGDGFECYVGISGLGDTLAKNIEAEVKKIGQNSRGIKKRKNSNGADYYYFIRQTKCPAIICEGVFVDTKADAAQADTDAECKAFGEAYAKGILKTLGIAEPTPKPAQTTTGTLYRVQVGAFKEKANADAMLKKVKAAGFDAFITTA